MHAQDRQYSKFEKKKIASNNIAYTNVLLLGEKKCNPITR